MDLYGWPGFRLCTGVGNSLAEETAREREDDRWGRGGRAQGREQQVWTKEGTAGTVEGKVCSESEECWAAHGKGARSHSTSFTLLMSLEATHFYCWLITMYVTSLPFRRKQQTKRRQSIFWNLVLLGMCWRAMLRNSVWELHCRLGQMSLRPTSWSEFSLVMSNIPTSRDEWIDSNFYADIHGSQSIYHCNYSHSFPYLCLKRLDIYCMTCHKISYTYLCAPQDKLLNLEDPLSCAINLKLKNFSWSNTGLWPHTCKATLCIY